MLKNDRQKLRTHREALMATGLGWVTRVRKFQTAINMVCILGGSALGAIAGSMEGGILPSSGDGCLTIKGVLVWMAALLCFGGGIVLYFIQDEGPKLLERASDLEKAAQSFLDERDGLHQRLQDLSFLDDKRLALIEANRIVRATLEQALLVPSADLIATLQLMLDASILPITTSIGFETREEWAISIFQVENDTLVRKAGARAKRLPEPNQPRSWKKNEGYVGAAWAGEKDIIIGDSRESAVVDEYKIPTALERAHDDHRYRSMAAIPIRVGNPPEIWGIVAASTDCAQRFRRDPGNKQVQAVDTVRAIARMIALAAAAFARSKQ